MIAVFVQKPSFHLFLLKLIPGNTKGRGSSVVERIIGNDEAGSSILPRGTSLSCPRNSRHSAMPDRFAADNDQTLCVFERLCESAHLVAQGSKWPRQ